MWDGVETLRDRFGTRVVEVVEFEIVGRDELAMELAEAEFQSVLINLFETEIRQLPSMTLAPPMPVR